MRTSSVIVAGALIAAGFSLGACREEEQDRILLFQKGAYLGQPDTQLTEEARQALRQRSQFQRTTQAGAVPSAGAPALGGPPGLVPAVRIPLRAERTGPPEATRETLRTRARKQY
ncbi:MAG: hypothetical protein ACE5JZ_12595 [Kiloniellales bacterium]